MKIFFRILILALTVVTVMILSIPAFAQELDSAVQDQVKNQMDAVGADELLSELPQDADELLDNLNVSELTPQTLLALSPSDFFKVVWQMFTERLKAPMATFSCILGVVLLCTLLSGLKASLWENSLSSVFSVVSVLCIATAIATPILDCIVSTSRAIREFSNFIVSFIPVFTGVLTVSGQPVTATTYHMFLFGACQIAAQIAAGTLVPLMGIYLAFCIAGSVMQGVDIYPTADIIRKLVTWGLGLICTIFVALLSVQTLVSAGTDTVAVKTTKFLIGSAIPIVGGALSEAFTAAQGCLKLLKTTVGAFGIIVAALTFLPVLLQTVTWYFTVNIAGAIGQMLGAKQASDILKATSATLGVLIAVISCFALLVIVSTTIILLMGMG